MISYVQCFMTSSLNKYRWHLLKYQFCTKNRYSLNLPAPLFKHNWNIKQLQKNLKSHRWSTFVLVCFSWLLNHVIYLNLRLFYCSYKLNKFTIVTQNDNFFYPGPFWVKIVVILWICSACKNSIFFLCLR